MPDYGKVVVTGGAGLIGSHIVDLLVAGREQGTYGDIMVFDNLTRGRMSNLADAMERGPVEVVDGDVRDVDAVTSAIDGADLVFHLAAIRITHCAEDPRLAHDVLGTGTFNVVDAATKAGVSKVIASSSASVYGLAESFPTVESHHSYHNRTLYGALKVYNEGLLRSYNDMFGLPYVGLRYFNVYGPRMDTVGVYTEVLIRWMNRITAGKSPLIFGSGEQTMDFIYATDIARANVLAAQSDASDEIFNVASATETSLNGLAAALSQVMGSDLAPEHGPERSVNPVSRRLADMSAAKERLGFEAHVDLHAGLTELVNWWRLNGDPT